MSGAEAGLVLGLVSSIISICEAANDLWQAAHDAKGLPKKLKIAAEELPLILVSLEQSRSNIDAAARSVSMTTESWQKVNQVLESCYESCTAVKSLFDSFLPSTSDDRAKRYAKAWSLKRKSGETEQHITKIFRHIQTLAEYQVIRDTDTLEDIKAAVIALQDLDAEEGDCQVMHGDGHNIQQSGSGTIRTYTNSGSGSMYNAETMNQNFGKVEKNYYYAESAKQRYQISFFKTSNYVSFKNDPNPPRAPNTCLWFLRHPTFLWWLQSEFNNILWVLADPGCGKSVLSRLLIDEILPSQTQDKVVYFFFKDNDLQHGVCTAMCAVLHQLFSQKPTMFERKVHPELTTHGKGIKDDFEALWDLFMQSTIMPKDDKMDLEASNIICVFDGFDECRTSDRERLVARLSSFFRTKCAQKSSSRITLKFLVTTRPYVHVVQPFTDIFAQYPSVRLDGNQEQDHICAEVESVIRAEVATYGVSLGLTSEMVQAASMAILDHQNRTYLWVKFVFEEIRNQSPTTATEFMQLVRQLPSSVEEAYEGILTRCSNRGRATLILACIVAARRPLDLHELDVILALDTQENAHSYADLQRDMAGPDARAAQIRQHCALFVRVVGFKLDLIHQTAYEFLVRPEYNTIYDVRKLAIGSGQTWKHCMTLAEAHSQLAALCMRFLASLDSAESFFMSDAPKSTSVGGKGEEQKYHFGQYASREWASHLNDAHVDSSHPSVSLALAAYNSGYYKRLLRLRRPFSQLPTIPPVFLRSSDITNSFALECDMPSNILDLICYHGHLSVLQAIDLTQFAYRDLSRALFQASSFAQNNLVRLLVKHIREHFSSVDLTSALQVAACRGHVRTIKVLTDAGANVHKPFNAKPRSGTLLCWAIENGKYHVAEALLQLEPTGVRGRKDPYRIQRRTTRIAPRSQQDYPDDPAQQSHHFETLLESSPR